MSKLNLKKKGQELKVQEDKLGIKIDDKDSPKAKNDEVTTEVKKNLIFQRAIASAQKHSIELEPGRKNSGGGDCSYLSVIYNINERRCFNNKFIMSPEYYRRIWTIDLMNKVLDKKIPWNPGMSRQEIQEGFQEIMQSGVYERSFFGDLMMAGIACGVRKRILIFNTHENTVHDPISVVDPRDYGSDIDSQIPVVVSYNLVHFESLHPVDEQDIEETINLANSYSSGTYREKYGFTRQDMSHLISKKIIDTPPESLKQREQDQIASPPPKKLKCVEKAKNKAPELNNENEKNTKEREDFIFEDIRFKEAANGKIKCGVCEVECTKLIVHLNGNKYCTEYFSNMAELTRKYSEFRDKLSRRKTAGKRKAQDQNVDKRGSKKVQSSDTKEFEPIKQDNIVDSFPTSGDNKSEACQKMAAKSMCSWNSEMVK